MEAKEAHSEEDAFHRTRLEKMAFLSLVAGLFVLLGMQTRTTTLASASLVTALAILAGLASAASRGVRSLLRSPPASNAYLHVAHVLACAAMIGTQVAEGRLGAGLVVHTLGYLGGMRPIVTQPEHSDLVLAVAWAASIGHAVEAELPCLCLEVPATILGQASILLLWIGGTRLRLRHHRRGAARRNPQGARAPADVEAAPPPPPPARGGPEGKSQAERLLPGAADVRDILLRRRLRRSQRAPSSSPCTSCGASTASGIAAFPWWPRR